LNPSHYHLRQLQDAKINDFEIVKRDRKYYVHISMSKEIPDKVVLMLGLVRGAVNVEKTAVTDTELACVNRRAGTRPR